MIKTYTVLIVAILFISCTSKEKEVRNEITVAYETAAKLGEGSIWNHETNELYWIDIEGKSLNIFNPKTNKMLRKIEVPAHNITSCAFGGKNLDTLYITTAKLDMNEEETKKYPLAGSVFKIVPGVKGVKSSFFK